MPSDARSLSSWMPPGPNPFVAAPDAFASATARSPSVLEANALQLLDRPTQPTVKSAHGLVALQADQTHYSDGFALFMGVAQGCAVALQPTEAPSTLHLSTGETVPLTLSEQLPAWGKAIRHVLEALPHDAAASHWQMGVVNALPASCGDSTLAALLIAVRRALADHLDARPLPSLTTLAAAASQAYDRPVGIAPFLAARATAPKRFVLVDTATHEHLSVPTEAASALAWAVIETARPPLRPPVFYREKKAQADEALAHLRANGFSDLRAFRDLEHRDLERAGQVLPEKLRPIVRHLVTENRRVQRYVAGLRQSDWQMVGGLLRMSHASLRTTWNSTAPPADVLVDVTERPSMDGLYGACMTERDGAVLVVGRPSTVTEGLHHLNDAVEAQHGASIRILPPF